MIHPSDTHKQVYILVRALLKEQAGILDRANVLLCVLHSLLVCCLWMSRKVPINKMHYFLLCVDLHYT